MRAQAEDEAGVIAKDAPGMQQINPVPRISIQAFCETPEIAAIVQAAIADRRMNKAHIKLHMGGAPAALKFGVINVQAAVQSTAEGKLAGAELQSQFAPRQTELQNMQKQITDDEARLRAGQTTLSDDEKARLAREYDTLNRSFQRKTQDAQDDFNQAQPDDRNGERQKRRIDHD